MDVVVVQRGMKTPAVALTAGAPPVHAKGDGGSPMVARWIPHDSPILQVFQPESTPKSW